MNARDFGRGLRMGMNSINLDPSPRLRNSREQLRASPDAMTMAWKDVGNALRSSMTAVARTYGLPAPK